jgi:diguanylate cyclase (GGDEF)-like protein
MRLNAQMAKDIRAVVDEESATGHSVCREAGNRENPGKRLSAGGSTLDRTLTSNKVRRLIGYAHRLPKPLLLSVGFFMSLGTGILNFFAGPELFSSIFYFVPIFMTTWVAGRGMGVLMSVISALTWLTADVASGVHYSHFSIPYWNGVARTGAFILLTFVLWGLKKALDHEKELSRVDYLTGVPNRRYFIEMANREIHRARRYHRPFSLVCIDLDDFKTVNDRFGHSMGDNLLRWVATTLQKNIRASDTVARLGGDEFVILLPETDAETAQVVTQNLQKAHEGLIQRYEWAVTLSMGAVTFTSAPSTVDDMLKGADGLMYLAKNRGKNRVTYEVLGSLEYVAVAGA